MNRIQAPDSRRYTVKTPDVCKAYVNGEDVSGFDVHKRTWLRCRNIDPIFRIFNRIPVMAALENCTIPVIFTGMSAQDADDIRRCSTPRSASSGFAMTMCTRL